MRVPRVIPSDTQEMPKPTNSRSMENKAKTMFDYSFSSPYVISAINKRKRTRLSGVLLRSTAVRQQKHGSAERGRNLRALFSAIPSTKTCNETLYYKRAMGHKRQSFKLGAKFFYFEIILLKIV